MKIHYGLDNTISIVINLPVCDHAIVVMWQIAIFFFFELDAKGIQMVQQIKKTWGGEEVGKGEVGEKRQKRAGRDKATWQGLEEIQQCGKCYQLTNL